MSAKVAPRPTHTHRPLHTSLMGSTRRIETCECGATRVTPQEPEWHACAFCISPAYLRESRSA